MTAIYYFLCLDSATEFFTIATNLHEATHFLGFIGPCYLINILKLYAYTSY